jgi:phage baseplate assembly protein W
VIRRQDEGGSWPPEDARGEALSPLARTARLILEVVPGERRLLPEFGCRVHRLPAISTDADRRLAAALIEEALDLWAPSLRVDRAEVTSCEDGAIAVVLRARGSTHELTIIHRHGHDPVLDPRDGAGDADSPEDAASVADPRGEEAAWRGRQP